MKTPMFLLFILLMVNQYSSHHPAKQENVHLSPSPFEILINEIHADPTPSVGLPNAEFIELYNHSDHFFETSDLVLLVNAREVKLPQIIMAPRSYHIICESKYADEFTVWGNVIPIPDLPAIPNAGSLISIIDNKGITIHGVDYHENWHQNSEKANGGWSLELVDPGKACYPAENWNSSVGSTGGTPGRLNSLTSSETPMDSLQIITIFPESDDRLAVVFNRYLLNIINTEISWFTISSGSQQFTDVYFEDRLKTTLLLLLDRPLINGILYSVRISGVRDCLGMGPKTGPMKFKLPESVSSGDILINEILFNPETGGKDFVELLNHSQKFLALDDLWLANPCPEPDVERLTLKYLLKPGEIIAISEDVRTIQRQYRIMEPHRLFESPLPAFDNDFGCIVLYSLIGNHRVILDSFYYDASFHSPLLADREGVSLERVSPDQPTNHSDNWQSAAKSAGFATPGVRNSQQLEAIFSSDKFVITPITFSPDGDGFDDLLQIHFTLDRPVLGLLIKIFDIRGRLIRYLIKGEAVPVSGMVIWDGSTEQGDIAPTGVYTLYIKTYDDRGHFQQSIKNCILALNY